MADTRTCARDFQVGTKRFKKGAPISGRYLNSVLTNNLEDYLEPVKASKTTGGSD